ncbi:MAG: metal-dependent hydrolase [Thermodesulfobacteriota bacterium]
MQITWLGHTGFRIERSGAGTILIDPWVDHPKSTDSVRAVDKADLILVTHGHGDHVGSLLYIAEKTGAVIVCIHEIAVYLNSKDIPNRIVGMNKGGTAVFEGVRVTMVHADHSSSIQDGNRILPGGEAVGYVLRFDSGHSVYHAGDTGVFGDMALIHRLYAPRVAMLPIGDHYTMGPAEAALAAELIRPECIIPMHYGTFPVLTGTPEALVQALPEELKGRVLALAVGQEAELE